MSKNSDLIKKILFNSLVILTIILIYLLFFPKKSYIESKLNNELNPIIEETFNQNIKSMEIAANNYFSENNEEKITLKQLIDKNLLVDLKDSNGNICDSNNSYIENKDNKLNIYLKCNEKEETIEITKENTSNDNIEKPNNENNIDNTKEKLLCLYEYRKKLPDTYTEWSEFSNWQTEEVKSNDLTNVEIKKEHVLDGTKIITEQKEINIEATKKIRLACPSDYIESNGTCIKETKLNTVTASFSYTCPNGYTKNGTNCYKNGNTIKATKNYTCPNNQSNIRFELSNDKCNVISIKYLNITNKEEYYTCPNGYNLSGNKCYSNIAVEKEVENYKEVTYYRYQTRKKNNEKYDIKWSRINNNTLLESEYNMIRKIICEF